jgi:DNA-damage-inducible protein J
MPKSSSISARIDPEIKKSAERIFRQLGLTASQAITLFYKQVELRKGIPFPVELPNEATQAALEEAKEREKLPKFDTTKELYEELGL